MANKPNNPSLWSKAKSLARQKFDVYPSAYANGWAAKWYKGKGGTWRKAAFGMEIPSPGDGRASSPGPGLTPRQMEEWNRLIDFIGAKGYAGSKDLDVRSKGLGRQLFDEFKTANPDVSIDYGIVPLAQKEFLGFQKENEGFRNRRGITRGDQFDRLSKEDSWLGSYTSQQKFIPLIERIVDPSGKLVSEINKGLINAQGIPSSMRDASGNQLGVRIPQGANVQKWSDGQYYIENPQSGDFVPLTDFAKQGNRFYAFGGKMTSGDISIPPLPIYAQGGEPDGGMALQQMNAVIDKLSNLRKFITPDSDLEPWISSKLAVMDHYADAVSDYMTYGQDGKENSMKRLPVQKYGGWLDEYKK